MSVLADFGTGRYVFKLYCISCGRWLAAASSGLDAYLCDVGMTYAGERRDLAAD